MDSGSGIAEFFFSKSASPKVRMGKLSTCKNRAKDTGEVKANRGR
ncbi:MAG: hypothetical protein V7L31_05575 [Nostoc sp.]